MKYKTCPQCDSKNTTVATNQFAGSANRAFKNRVCIECGTAWGPACPRTVAIALVILGCLIPVMEHAINKNFRDLGNAMQNSGLAAQGAKDSIWPYLFGGLAIVGGLSVLFGSKGKVKILGKSLTTLK